MKMYDKIEDIITDINIKPKLKIKALNMYENSMTNSFNISRYMNYFKDYKYDSRVKDAMTNASMYVNDNK